MPESDGTGFHPQRGRTRPVYNPRSVIDQVENTFGGEKSLGEPGLNGGESL